jgi:hypothetical protein
MGNRKINIKFQLVSVKIVTKSIDTSESRIRISVPAFLRFHLINFLLYSGHSRLSEQFSESQVAFGTNLKSHAVFSRFTLLIFPFQFQEAWIWFQFSALTRIRSVSYSVKVCI